MPPVLTQREPEDVTLGDLARQLGADVVGARSDAAPLGRPLDTRISGVTLDSRSVRPGDLYAALAGANVHGARFGAAACAAGAVAVLTDPEGATLLGELPAPVLVVPSPRAVLGDVAATVYGRPARRIAMVGITGTNGKTTTAYLVESALRALGRRTGLIGTVETRIGDERIESVRTTPEAPDVHRLLATMVARGVDTCVMEVSSHALELHRVDAVRYDVALFTNLSQDHLDFHHTMEDYFLAKASLLTPERCVRAVVCVDDDWGRRLAAEASVPVTTLSTGRSAEAAAPASAPRADWWVEPGSGDTFTLVRSDDGRRLPLVSHLPGTFNVANTALAALALLALAVSPDDVATALATPPAVPGRMEIVEPGGVNGPRCIVDFAHTPDAVDAALAALRPSTVGRLIAVLGAGGDRDARKRPAMGAAAARHADVVVVTDDNPRSERPEDIRDAVAAGARELVERGAARATLVVDGGARGAAIAEAIAMAMLDLEDPTGGRVDTVVVLGKGHETGQEVKGVKHPFDDRAAVRAALEAVQAAGR